MGNHVPIYYELYLYSLKIWKWIISLYDWYLGMSLKHAVLQWVASHVSEQPADLSRSWRDGTILCELLEDLLPNAFHGLKFKESKNWLNNVQLALDVIEKKFEIQTDLSAVQVVCCTPDAEEKLQNLLLELKTVVECRSKDFPKNYDQLVSCASDEDGTVTKKCSLIKSTSVKEHCSASGTGLALAFVGRKSTFELTFGSLSDIDVVIEIKGPENTLCCERITSRSPKYKSSDSSFTEKIRRLSAIGRSVSQGDFWDTSKTPMRKKSREIPLEYTFNEKCMSVCYTPLVIGKHQISILWRGRNISLSPYHVNVEEYMNFYRERKPPSFQQLETCKETSLSDQNDPEELNTSKAVVSPKEPVNLKVGNIIHRKVLRYIVKLGKEEVMVEVGSSELLASALLQLDYNDKDQSGGRRNSWGFVGDVHAQRRLKFMRQLCIKVDEDCLHRRSSFNGQCDSNVENEVFVGIEGKRSKVIEKNDLSEEEKETQEKPQPVTDINTIFKHSGDPMNFPTKATSRLRSDSSPSSIEVLEIESAPLSNQKNDTNVEQKPVGIDKIQSDRKSQSKESESGEREELVKRKPDEIEWATFPKDEECHTHNISQHNKCNTLCESVRSSCIVDSMNANNQKKPSVESKVLPEEIEKHVEHDKIPYSKCPNCERSVFNIAPGHSREAHPVNTRIETEMEICAELNKNKVDEAKRSINQIPNSLSNGDGGKREFSSCRLPSENSVERNSAFENVFSRTSKRIGGSICKWKSRRNGKYIWARKRRPVKFYCQHNEPNIKVHSCICHTPLHQCSRIREHIINCKFERLLQLAETLLQNQTASSAFNCKLHEKMKRLSDKLQMDAHSNTFRNPPKSNKGIEVPFQSTLRSTCFSSRDFKPQVQQLHDKSTQISPPGEIDYHSHTRKFKHRLHTITSETDICQDQNEMHEAISLIPESLSSSESSNLEQNVDNDSNSETYSDTIKNFTYYGNEQNDYKCIKNRSRNFTAVDKGYQHNALLFNDDITFNDKVFPPLAITENLIPIKNRIRQWEDSLLTCEAGDFHKDPKKSSDIDKLPFMVNIQSKLAFWERGCEPHKAPQQTDLSELYEPTEANQLRMNLHSNVDETESDRTQVVPQNTEKGRLRTDDKTLNSEKEFLLGNSFQHLGSENTEDSGISDVHTRHLHSLKNLQFFPHFKHRNLSDFGGMEPPSHEKNSLGIEKHNCKVLCSSDADAEDSYSETDSSGDEYIDDEIPDYVAMFLGEYHSFTGLLDTSSGKGVVDPSFQIPGVQNTDMNFLNPYFDLSKECRVSGIGVYYGQVSINNQFQVLTKGAGKGNLSISIQGSGRHDVTKISVLYTTNDVYDVIYRVMEPGYYVINVRWSDWPVPGSPFICKVTY